MHDTDIRLTSEEAMMAMYVFLVDAYQADNCRLGEFVAELAPFEEGEAVGDRHLARWNLAVARALSGDPFPDD